MCFFTGTRMCHLFRLLFSSYGHINDVLAESSHSEQESRGAQRSPEEEPVEEPRGVAAFRSKATFSLAARPGTRSWTSLFHMRGGALRQILPRMVGSEPRMHDINKPLQGAAQTKAQQNTSEYAHDRNIGFLPAICSTSGRVHDEFLRALLACSPSER